MKISKNNGAFRNVYSVDPEQKAALRAHLPDLEAIVSRYDENDVIYGFRKDRNSVLNAFQHLGFEFTLSMDLADFFDHVRPEQVSNKVSKVVIDECFIDRHAYQGLPTSPAIANLAFLPVDNIIVREIAKLSQDIVYTRYADDLTFSFNERRLEPMIEVLVSKIIKANGFLVNESKTRFQNLKNGRIVITGVGIDRYGIHATRKTLKKIRAAQHQGNSESEAGLVEWSQCKLPKNVTG